MKRSVFLIVLAVSAFRLSAQVSVEAQIDSIEIFVGQQVHLTLTAHAKENANYNENKEFEERICAALRGASEPMQVDELAELIGCTFARQRLTAICTNLIREGRIKSCDVKTKKGKRKGYYI